MEAPLTSLYQELILEHYRNPRNKGELDDRTVEAYVANPVCGDEISVQLRLDGDRIEEIRFDGQGCSISQASVSMMTALVKGRERSEACSPYPICKRMLRSCWAWCARACDSTSRGCRRSRSCQK